MNPHTFLEKVRTVFIERANDPEDDDADDSLLQHNRWYHNDNIPFKKCSTQAHSSDNPTSSVSLDIYKLEIGSEEKLDVALREIAKNFYDLTQKSYTFQLIPNITSIFFKFFDPASIENLAGKISDTHDQIIVEVYAEEEDGFFLSLGPGVLFVYDFCQSVSEDF